MVPSSVRLLACIVIAACSPRVDPVPDAEVLTDYSGSLVVHPHGSMYSTTSDSAVALGTTYAKAGDCTLTHLTNDNGALSFDCSAATCMCAADRIGAANGMIADPMLTLHWSKLSFDDELTDYDFTGTRTP